MTDPDPDSMPLAAAAIKRTAAKKTAVKKAAATAAKSPAKSPAKKATTKKAATKKATTAPKAVLAPPPPEPAPAPKKTARKKTAAAPVVPIPLPPPPAPPEPAAPAPRKKAAARKSTPKASPAPEPDLFTLKETPAAEPAPPTRTRRKTAPAPEPVPTAPPPTAPEPTPAPLPAAHSPSPQDASPDSQPDSQQRHQFPQSDSADSQNRRLSKFERWKQRKEKFKLIKQQRYLERQTQGPSSPTPDAPPDSPPPHPLDPLNRLDRGDRNDRSDRNDRLDRNDRGRLDRRGDRGRSNDRRGPDRSSNRDRSPDRDRMSDRSPDRDRFDRDGDRSPRPDPNLGPPEPVSGLLEMTPGKGFGFLRDRARGFQPLSSDAFVSPDLVRQLGLRDGVWIDGSLRRGSRGPQITEITAVNGRSPDIYRTLPLFEELTAINPSKRYLLETISNRHTTRIIDFIAPIGRGQRGLIVAPPRAGKTTILQHIAEAIQENYEDTKLIILLVDERPEEVTEIARALPSAEVMASNNDRDPREHLRVAQLAIERARRLVEAGEHVFMLLDSITRLARAFNNAIRGQGGGKGSLSGGVDARALEGARRLFAAARNTREAGSLTIVATALIETNSRADELIFQEFKGTGNMELVLDRRIAQQYIYPAVDIFKSGTRREELLLPPHQMEKVHLIRRGLAGHKPVEAAERLIHFMNKFPSNAQMLIEIKSRE